MSRAAKWRELFESKGWIKDDVIRCQEDGRLKITIAGCCGSPQNHTVSTDSAMILTELGMLLVEDEGIKIFETFPNIKEVFAKAEISKNDKIVSINDTKVKSIKEFEKIYNSVKVGEKISLGISHEGETVKTVVIKPAKPDNMEIQLN